uniref:Uncharacterized protein n=1 Tax=Picea glauca TaxID=3330 RepID=A0A101LY09_PICGL|nr:hypothetical protein ABT39_MTgene5632 [Picea glauca]QHR88081.1 hypothetical protein Q903MT_gene2094 [Picea sitchensis]
MERRPHKQRKRSGLWASPLWLLLLTPWFPCPLPSGFLRFLHPRVPLSLLWVLVSPPWFLFSCFPWVLLSCFSLVPVLCFLGLWSSPFLVSALAPGLCPSAFITSLTKDIRSLTRSNRCLDPLAKSQEHVTFRLTFCQVQQVGPTRTTDAIHQKPSPQAFTPFSRSLQPSTFSPPVTCSSFLSCLQTYTN